MAGEVPGDVADAGSLDPPALGFMCGLEIHQQFFPQLLQEREYFGPSLELVVYI